jgi:hypothetical protein
MEEAFNPPTTKEYGMCILHDVELASVPQGAVKRP